MPELHTHTRNIPTLEYGAYHGIGGWVPLGIGLGSPSPFLFSLQGRRFQIYEDPSLEKTRLRELSLYISLARHAGFGFPVLGNLTVNVELNADTEPNSNTNTPLTGTRQILFQGDPGWSNPTVPAVATVQLSSSTITDPLGPSIPSLDECQVVFDNYNSNGIANFGIALTLGLASVVEVADCYLIATELDFFTGVAGAKGRERGDSRARIVRDSRFGMPAWSDELVEDGDSPGYWVRPEHSDPEDPEREYTGNPREGVRDDDVPLE